MVRQLSAQELRCLQSDIELGKAHVEMLREQFRNWPIRAIPLEATREMVTVGELIEQKQALLDAHLMLARGVRLDGDGRNSGACSGNPGGP